MLLGKTDLGRSNRSIPWRDYCGCFWICRACGNWVYHPWLIGE